MIRAKIIDNKDLKDIEYKVEICSDKEEPCHLCKDIILLLQYIKYLENSEDVLINEIYNTVGD